jgi:Fic family protein
MRVDLTSPVLVGLIERAHALASVTREIPIPPYLQLKLDTLNIMRAVRGTTAIEGADVTPEEVEQIMASPGLQTLPEARRRDEQEVRNARDVMFFVANRLTEQPDLRTTQEVICTLNQLVTRNIDYEGHVPGIYRTHAVTAAARHR